MASGPHRDSDNDDAQTPTDDRPTTAAHQAEPRTDGVNRERDDAPQKE
jgi:hypothetical protein